MPEILIQMPVSRQTELNAGNLRHDAGEMAGLVMLLVDGNIPRNIKVKYEKDKSSLYSEEHMKISCYSLDDCFQLSGQPDRTEYEPLDDGFGITSIEIEGNTYLQQTEVGLCTYPQANLSDNTVIVHGPREINGYERQLNGEQTLVLGVIVCRHDQPDETTDYQWSRDGSIIHNGHNCCMIPVDQPGQYAVSVNQNGHIIISDTVTISQIQYCYEHDEPFENVFSSHGEKEKTLSVFGESQIQYCYAPLENVLSNPGENPNTQSVVRETLNSQPVSNEHDEQVTIHSVCDENLAVQNVSEEHNVVMEQLNIEELNTHNSASNYKMNQNKRQSNECTFPSPPKKLKFTLPLKDNYATNDMNETGQSDCVPLLNYSDINVGEEIGKGAFGTVYKGDWLGTNVAVKKIKVKRMKIMQKMVHSELQVHSKIRHPNVIQLMGYTTHDDCLCLISEFVGGPNLDDILFGSHTGDWKMPDVSVKLDITKKITQAVAYLHNLQPCILHRDIKPENVLIANDYKIVKLCDMGLSKIKTMNTMVSTLAGGQVLQPGTPSYQAPEVLLEKCKSSKESDVWSLSCTLVEVFTEEPIWMIDELTNSSVESVSSAIDTIRCHMRVKRQPHGLESLVEKAGVPMAIIENLSLGLHYEAKFRPSALDMLMELKKITL